MSTAGLLPAGFSIGAAAVDTSGFIYLTGNARSRGIPGAPGSLQPAPRACAESESNCVNFFIAKIAPSGDKLVWLTYFRGNGNDTISAIAVAPDGTLLVAGATTSTELFPDLHGYSTAPASLFLARLSANGDRLLHATHFGADGADSLSAVKIDAAGNVYIAGTANSARFPTTPGAYQQTRGSGPAPPGFYQCMQSCPDLFVAKFDPTLSKLIFSTLVGTSVEEISSDLALGPDGSLYLAGTKGPYGGQGPGPTYPMLWRLNSSATALLFEAQISGPGRFPHGGPLVVAQDGSAYLSTFTPRWLIVGAFSTTWKVDAQGAQLWGKEINGLVTSMALNSANEIVVTGLASDLWLRPTPGASRGCISLLDYGGRGITSFVARWNPSRREVTYAGFLNASSSVLAGPDLVVASSPYVGFSGPAVLPAGIPPHGTVTCVTNAAGYDSAAVSPGEVLSVFGSGIGPDAEYPTEFDADGLVRSELGGITASIGGLPAPILFASPGQIDLVTPFAVPTTGTVPIVVRRKGETVVALDRPAAETHAALFVTDGLRSGTLLALNEDATMNSSGNPATLGSRVSVFATGLGTMTPVPLDGAVAGDEPSRPLTSFRVILTDVTVVDASVEYVGSSPGLVQGIVRIDFRLPTLLHPVNGAVSVGFCTNTGTLFVR